MRRRVLVLQRKHKRNTKLSENRLTYARRCCPKISASHSARTESSVQYLKLSKTSCSTYVSTVLIESTSDSLVGKRILHRFETDGEEQWYSGVVVSYNAVNKLFEIAYDDEEDHCFFNLLQDLAQGDLVVHSDVDK